VIKELKISGYQPQVIAAALAFSVGIISFALGILKLGFLLDFISAPVLTGFISAAAIVIVVGQVPSLLGLDNVRPAFADAIHDIITMFPKAQWPTVLIGLAGIILLEVLAFIGKRWAKKNAALWGLSIGRAAIALALFTGISFALNRSRPDKPVFAISKATANGIAPPRAPDLALVKKVAIRAIAPFIAASLEHIAIGKAFAHRNGYHLDQSQELTYLGLTNFFNSFFTAMPVGGAMSRTAVASESGTKSPLNGAFTAAFVILGIYKLTGALFWIPKATLAAIIVTAVFHLIGPLSLFYRYWRTSLADFTASQICFWVTLFVSAETGIEFAVAFAVAYTLIRSAFSTVRSIDGEAINSTSSDCGLWLDIPFDTKIFQFRESLLFMNAYRTKDRIMDIVSMWHSSRAETRAARDAKRERNWSVAGEKRIRWLRARAGIISTPPPLRVLILDFSKVSHIDSTGLGAIADLRSAGHRFSGGQCEVRFLGLNENVRTRFNRNGWILLDSRILDDDSAVADGSVLVYENLAQAVLERRRDIEMISVDAGKV
jgi:solute carrier family 26 (sodium-independent sulfate anion transporter), member 11